MHGVGIEGRVQGVRSDYGSSTAMVIGAIYIYIYMYIYKHTYG